MSKIYKVLDLFSGCGGMSLGFEQAGFKIVAGIDMWADAIQTFKKNHPESLAIVQDVSSVNLNELSKLTGAVDIIIGGPPCQGFSISGKRNPSDPRNKLYSSYVNVVNHFKPKVFVLENVPNIMSMDSGSFKDKIVNDFTKIGYTVTSQILLASDYGVPQNRRRAFFVGLKNNKQFKFPQVSCSNKISTKQAISDLPDFSQMPGSAYASKPKSEYQEEMRKSSLGVYNHEIALHTPQTIEIISMVPDGGNYKALPLHLQRTRKVNIAWTRFNSKKPSHTIDTGHNHHFHYKYNRVPTVRESARLQSFPDDFVFLGNKTSQFKQVGNAVPPMLAYSIAKQLQNYL